MSEAEELAIPPVAPGTWPADLVERRPLAGLIPYARNARIHSTEQIAQIAASIREWGWTVPILVDEDGVLIAGHGRVLAAHRLGLANVPTLVARGWTDAQKRAYRLADNKLALNADWDNSILQSELGELRLAAFDLAPIGFSEMEIASILAPDTNPDAEWQGMPDYDQGSQGAFLSLVVHFADPAAVEEFSRRLGQKMPTKVRYLWFPEVERQNTVNQRYAAT